LGPKKITSADQDLTETYQQEIGEILEFLGQDIEECLITDESSIYDFSTCYPEAECPVEACGSYMEVDRWDAWLERAWHQRFPCVALGQTHTESRLVNLAARIRNSRNVQ
jgi:hypothetical protein